MATTASSASRLFGARAAFSSASFTAGSRLWSPARTTCSASQPKLPETSGTSSLASSTSPGAAAPLPSYRADRPSVEVNSAAAATADSAQTGVSPCDETRTRPKSQHQKTLRDQLADLHPLLGRVGDAFNRSWKQDMARGDHASVTTWDSVLNKVFRRKPDVKVSADYEVTFYEIRDYLKAGLRLKVLIDVREPAEYAEGHIPGAHNVPLNSVLSQLKTVENIYLEEEKRITGKMAVEGPNSLPTTAGPARGATEERDLLDFMYDDNDNEPDPLRLPTFIFYCSNGERARVAYAIAVSLGYKDRSMVYRPSYNEWSRFINYEPDLESA